MNKLQKGLLFMVPLTILIVGIFVCSILFGDGTAASAIFFLVLLVMFAKGVSYLIDWWVENDR